MTLKFISEKRALETQNVHQKEVILNMTKELEEVYNLLEARKDGN